MNRYCADFADMVGPDAPEALGCSLTRNRTPGTTHRDTTKFTKGAPRLSTEFNGEEGRFASMPMAHQTVMLPHQARLVEGD